MPKSKATVGEKINKSTQYGRDVYVTEEGNNVSELSVTVPIGDKWYNAPSIHNGVRYEENEIVDMINGGKIKPTSVHDSLEDALDAAETRTDNIKYANGGNVKQMNKLFADGGMMDHSGEVVNGVEVPPGSLKQEVADDVPAQLSEGEFVIPADVVRFIGLEKLMLMRDKAKAGLQKMQDMGQMGNAQEVDNPDQLFNGSEMPEEDLSSFESDIDNILAEDQQSFANGGAVMKFNNGGTPPDMSLPQRNYSNAPIIGFQMTKYTNKAGEVKYIPTIKGKAMLPVPEGFEVGEQAPIEEPVVEEPKVDTPDAISSSGSGRDQEESPSSGDSGSSGLPGEGISVEGQDAAFAALAAGENPLLQAMFPVLSKVSTFVANAYLDDQIDKMDAAASAVKENSVADSGMYTVAKKNGGIGLVSTTQSIAAQNDAVFGGYFNANGDWIESNAGIADQSRTLSVNKTSDLAWQAKANLEAEQEAARQAAIAAEEARKREAARQAAEQEAARKAAEEEAARQAAIVAEEARKREAARQAAEEEAARQAAIVAEEDRKREDARQAAAAESARVANEMKTSAEINTRANTRLTRQQDNIVYDGEGGVYSINGVVQGRSGGGSGGYSSGFSGGNSAYSGGFGSMSGSEGASVGGGGEARGGFISPKTSTKRRAMSKKGLASKK